MSLKLFALLINKESEESPSQLNKRFTPLGESRHFSFTLTIFWKMSQE